jgi:hypothetical protein
MLTSVNVFDNCIPCQPRKAKQFRYYGWITTTTRYLCQCKTIAAHHNTQMRKIIAHISYNQPKDQKNWEQLYSKKLSTDEEKYAKIFLWFQQYIFCCADYRQVFFFVIRILGKVTSLSQLVFRFGHFSSSFERQPVPPALSLYKLFANQAAV